MERNSWRRNFREGIMRKKSGELSREAMEEAWRPLGSVKRITESDVTLRTDPRRTQDMPKRHLRRPAPMDILRNPEGIQRRPKEAQATAEPKVHWS